MGWLPIHVEKEGNHFVDQVIHGRDFYFVHSYALLSATLQSRSFFHEYALPTMEELNLLQCLDLLMFMDVNFIPRKALLMAYPF